MRSFSPPPKKGKQSKVRKGGGKGIVRERATCAECDALYECVPRKLVIVGNYLVKKELTVSNPTKRTCCEPSRSVVSYSSMSTTSASCPSTFGSAALACTWSLCRNDDARRGNRFLARAGAEKLLFLHAPKAVVCGVW
jgi:hypothetical protein